MSIAKINLIGSDIDILISLNGLTKKIRNTIFRKAGNNYIDLENNIEIKKPVIHCVSYNILLFSGDKCYVYLYNLSSNTIKLQETIGINTELSIISNLISLIIQDKLSNQQNRYISYKFKCSTKYRSK